MNRVEILAPAGSYDICVAAINAGADAVYLGGSKYGARAFANNFTNEELLEAIKYAKRYNRKVYLTVNTLLKNKELNDLYDYLLPFYENGLDAVIVQDMGVFKYISDTFPDLPIHCSTQMTITTSYGASLMKSYGATRVVPARELSLSEIKSIKNNANIELEVFVQGALCYCYSGQCLLSSYIGGRSGNRGRCAQPCRMPYEVYKEGTRVDCSPYILSPKDMCGLSEVGELIEAGVDSFKIEGRMKSKEYVVANVLAYRKAVDCYVNNKPFDIDKVTFELKNIYNRGGFNQGYFHQYNGKNMMSMERPNHNGVLVGYIDKIAGNTISFTAKEDIYMKDVIEIRASKNIELTSNVEIKKGNRVTLNANNLKLIRKQQPVYRTRCERLLDGYTSYCEKESKEKIHIIVKLYKDKFAKVTVLYKNIEAEVEGDMVCKALRRPLSKQEVIDKITKLGNTPYECSNVEVYMDEDAFIPISSINELKRKIIEVLEARLSVLYKRETVPKKDISYIIPEDKPTDNTQINVLVSSREQYEAIKDIGGIDRVYIEEDRFSDTDIDYICSKADIYLALPYICRNDSLSKINNHFSRVKGILVRHIDQLAYIVANHMDIPIILDEGMYTFNTEAIAMYRNICDECTYTLSLEHSKADNIALSQYIRDSELIVYGYNRLMTSTQCVNKNTAYCDNISHKYELVDRKLAKFNVVNICKYCYNLLYSHKPMDIVTYAKDYTHTKAYRIQLTIEDGNESAGIVKSIIGYIQGREEYTPIIDETNHVYINRGIE